MPENSPENTSFEDLIQATADSENSEGESQNNTEEPKKDLFAELTQSSETALKKTEAEPVEEFKLEPLKKTEPQSEAEPEIKLEVKTEDQASTQIVQEETKIDELVAEIQKEEKEESSKLESPKESQVPAKLDQSSELSAAITSIKSDLQKITEKQHASPEFKALMDGYVNKANECETEKAKRHNLEEKYEELKIEFRELKEQNKKTSTDLDATKEALKSSESDLHKLENDYRYFKESAESKIQDLSEDKRVANQKLRDALSNKEKSSADLQSLQSKVLEAKHAYKQLEAEKNIERDNYERALKEAETMVHELKEQLDLRTRELEYKDALLNQLIKQVSEPIDLNTFSQQARAPQSQQMHYQQPQSQPQTSFADVARQQAASSPQTANYSQSSAQLFDDEDSGPIEMPARPKQGSSGMKWGAFKK